jgi:hypothetical protein
LTVKLQEEALNAFPVRSVMAAVRVAVQAPAGSSPLGVKVAVRVPAA